MFNIFHVLANGTRNSVLSPEDLENRKTMKIVLEMVRVAAAVASVGHLLLIVTATSIPAALGYGLGCWVCIEISVISGNILEILDNALVELSARLTKETLIHQLSKNTLIHKLILRLA